MDKLVSISEMVDSLWKTGIAPNEGYLNDLGIPIPKLKKIKNTKRGIIVKYQFGFREGQEHIAYYPKADDALSFFNSKKEPTGWEYIFPGAVAALNYYTDFNNRIFKLDEMQCIYTVGESFSRTLANHYEEARHKLLARMFNHAFENAIEFVEATPYYGKGAGFKNGIIRNSAMFNEYPNMILEYLYGYKMKFMQNYTYNNLKVPFKSINYEFLFADKVILPSRHTNN